MVSKVLENTRLARTEKCRGNIKKARPALALQPNAPFLANGTSNTWKDADANASPKTRGLCVNGLSTAAPTPERLEI